jgi:hypothetical protein
MVRLEAVVGRDAAVTAPVAPISTSGIALQILQAANLKVLLTEHRLAVPGPLGWQLPERGFFVLSVLRLPSSLLTFAVAPGRKLMNIWRLIS